MKTPGREGTLDCTLEWYPKMYSIVLSFVGFKFLELLLVYDLLGQATNVQTIQPIIVIYRSGNFVSKVWECTLIYRH